MGLPPTSDTSSTKGLPLAVASPVIAATPIIDASARSLEQLAPKSFDDQAAEHDEHRRREDEHERHEDDDAGAPRDLLGGLKALGARDVGLDAQDLDERRAALLRLDGVGDERFDELRRRAIREILERLFARLAERQLVQEARQLLAQRIALVAPFLDDVTNRADEVEAG